MVNIRWRPLGAVAALSLATGCAGVPLQQGRSQVTGLVQARTSASADALWSPQTGNGVSAQISTLLQQPLTADAAQRIALLANPGLRVRLATLDISAADVFEASRLPNPSIGASWLFPLSGADGERVGASAALGFADLLLRGTKRRLARAEFVATQQVIASEVLDLLADTELAWLRCVAASQRVAVREVISDAATLAAEFAARYHEAGNIGDLELQMQRAAATEAAIGLHAAQAGLADARATLQVVLGLRESGGSWQVPAVLPEVPSAASLPTLGTMQEAALQQRLDLAAARLHADAASARFAATRRYRWFGGARAGTEFEREPDGSKRIGPSLELELPLFQQGQGALARAAADQARSAAEMDALQVQVEAEVRQQLRHMELAATRAAAFRDALIPQRAAVVARQREQANFMLVDGFAVLVARQQEYAALEGYIEATLDYWSTRTELLRATGSQRSLETSR